MARDYMITDKNYLNWDQIKLKSEHERTLEEFRSSIRRAPTKRVEFIAERELIAEPKVRNFYV